MIYISMTRDAWGRGRRVATWSDAMTNDAVSDALQRIMADLDALLNLADNIDEPHLAALISDAKFCAEKLLRKRMH